MAGHTHLMLSGSTDSILKDTPPLEPAMRLVRDAVERGRPVLGICYGHQLVAKALLGDAHIRRAEPPEIGWFEIRPEPAFASLYEGLPNPFRSFVGHFDEVCDLPAGWQVTARSRDCEVHGVLNEELRVMGFQFHPEMDLEIGNLCFITDRVPLEKRGFDVGRILAEAADDGSGALLIPRFLAWNWP
jgi:GMP synthase (glutamine-hydrolysing)